MKRSVLLAALIFFALGCTDREETTTAAATTDAPMPAQVEATRDFIEPMETGGTPASSDLDLDEEAQASPARKATSAESSQGLAKPARDLSSELRAAVGSPVECLQDYRPSTGTVVRVSINAIVRDSGLVIEPSASGAGLSANDRRCIEERVGDVVLAPFEGEPSQSVSTTVDLVSTGGALKEENVGAPAPKLEDVVEPLPKKKTIPPSGIPIEKAPSDRPDGPHGDPIEGPKGVPITGPRPKPIDGYEVEEDSERWTD